MSSGTGGQVVREVLINLKYKNDPANAALFRKNAEQIKSLDVQATKTTEAGENRRADIKEAAAKRGFLLEAKWNRMAEAADEKRNRKKEAETLRYWTRESAIMDRELKKQQTLHDAAIRAMDEKREAGLSLAKAGAIDATKAIVLWGIAGSDSAEKILQRIVKLSAVIHSLGIIDLIKGLNQAGIFGTASGNMTPWAGRMAHGAGALAAGAGGVGALGAGAALIGAGAGASYAYDYAKGRPIGTGAGNWLYQKLPESTYGSGGFSSSLVGGGLGWLADRTAGRTYRPLASNKESDARTQRAQDRLTRAEQERAQREQEAQQRIDEQAPIQAQIRDVTRQRAIILSRGNQGRAIADQMALATADLNNAQNAPRNTEADRAKALSDEVRAHQELIHLTQQEGELKQQQNLDRRQTIQQELIGLRQEITLQKQLALEARNKINAGRESLGLLTPKDVQEVKRLKAKIDRGEELDIAEMQSTAGSTLATVSGKYGNAVRSQQRAKAERQFGEPLLNDIETDERTAETEANAARKAAEMKADDKATDLTQLKKDAEKMAEDTAQILTMYVDSLLKLLRAEADRKSGEDTVDKQAASAMLRSAAGQA